MMRRSNAHSAHPGLGGGGGGFYASLQEGRLVYMELRQNLSREAAQEFPRAGLTVDRAAKNMQKRTEMGKSI